MDSGSKLEVELADLLRSLDDLEAEKAAGDLDVADYENLRDSYTVRVAETMRVLEGQSKPVKEPASNRRRKLALTLMASVVFAVGAGYLLAQAAGSRRLGETLTGSIDSVRQQLLDCQELGGTGEIVSALECYDEVLIDSPDNAEALAYRGWFMVLTTGSAQVAGDEASAEELLEIGRTYLDRAVEADPDFADARAFRSAVYDRLGESENACAEVEALLALNPPPFFVQQTAGIAERNGCS